MPEPARDPWVVGGVVLLAVLTLGALQLYRNAPQTLADAGTRGLIAVRPSAFGPRIARAEERLRVAEAEDAAGQDSAAMTGFEAAAEQSLLARGFAESPRDSAAALGVWSRAMLARSRILLRTGTGPWWRRDDVARLRDALSSVHAVQAAPVEPPVRARADSLASAIERQLRPGPLEWLPGPR